MNHLDKTRVGLVQIGTNFSGQYYLPYSVGILQAFAQKHLPHPERFEFGLPIFKRVLVREAVEQLENCHIACFSIYIWNIRLSLAIARALKAKHPEILIVFGGPQVPKRERPWELEEFLRQNPFIDLAIHGIGEKPFLAFLEHGLARAWDKIPSVTYSQGGALKHTCLAETFKDLAEVPQPYTAGVFDALMEVNPDVKWIGLGETNRNCPFECTYCGWGLLAKKPIYWPTQDVLDVLDWFGKKKVGYIFFADANFGLPDRDVEISRHLVEVKKRYGYPQSVSVQDTKIANPNLVEKSYKIRTILMEGFGTPVVISMQTVSNQVAKAVKRHNIDAEGFFEIQKRFRSLGVLTMTDLILGLPEETYDSFVDGISLLIEKGQHNRVQFNNLSIVPDAELSHRDEVKKYGLETVFSPIVNIHGKIETDEVPEMQELVIASFSMRREDWVRARAFAWMSAFLHFDKVLQIVNVIGHAFTKKSYREIFELFFAAQIEDGSFPILNELRLFLLTKAREIQDGGSEYVHASQWMDINWPADEYFLIKMVAEEKLDAFYDEAQRLLEANLDIDGALLDDAFRLSRAVLKRPFQSSDLEVTTRTNVWEIYQAFINGEAFSIQDGGHRYRIDRTTEKWSTLEEWCQKVVWWCNRSGNYGYKVEACPKKGSGVLNQQPEEKSVALRLPTPFLERDRLFAMQYRLLGSTGIKVSEIGFGAWGIGGATSRILSYGETDDAESLSALQFAFDHGVTFYDTADSYGNGHSETLLGKAFGRRRDQVVLASKVGFVDLDQPQDFSPRHLRTSLEGSLRRLGTDYLDLLQLHSPSLDELRRDPSILETLEALRQEGKIRAFGLSVRSPEEGLAALEEFGFGVIQVNFNLIDQRALDVGLFEKAQASGAGLIIRTPLAFGFLSGKYGDVQFKPGDHRNRWSSEQLRLWRNAPNLFAPLNAGTNRTLTHLALRFCLAFHAVATVIPGMLTVDQVEENVGVLTTPPLSPAELDSIRTIYQGQRFFV
jgi:aryl-alcohol dehydrogenase-like predicted oxidoreductase/radical SAM superfamily enzyme YgiQ (UPF0313 family)